MANIQPREGQRFEQSLEVFVTLSCQEKEDSAWEAGGRERRKGGREGWERICVHLWPIHVEV